jgi:hypothetical protein
VESVGVLCKLAGIVGRAEMLGAREGRDARGGELAVPTVWVTAAAADEENASEIEDGCAL